jgi:capsule biosynthesis phosphatase
MKRLIIDVDNTLTIHDSEREYLDMMVNTEVVQKLILYRHLGFKITLFTARGMRSHDCNLEKIENHVRPDLVTWLEKNGIIYDELLIGKPWCGREGFYVDDKAIRPSEFVKLTYDEIRILLDVK